MEKIKKKKFKYCILFSIIVVCGIVFCCLSGHWLGRTVYGSDYYWSDATGDTHLGDIEMTNPASSYSEYWLVGSDHTVTCTTITDKDHKCHWDGDEWVYMGKVTDSITHYWTGTTGMFENDDNIGTSVSYICRYSEGVDGITCHADDNYSDADNYYRGQTGGDEGPEGPGGNDSSTSDTHYVYARGPYIEEFTWGTSKHDINNVTEPEYDSSASKNEPACYTKNSSVSASNVYFYDADNLTETSSVNVIACSRTLTTEERNSGDTPDTNIIWMSGSGSWKTWSSDKISSMSSGSEKLVDYVHKYNSNLPLYWYYEVSTVDSTYDYWFTCGSTSHTVYAVYGTPSCDNDLLDTNNLNTCVGWAQGCTKVDTSNDSTNVPRKVQLGAKNWYSTYGYQISTGIKTNPFTWIPANKGDCLTYADLMTKGLTVLGVTGSTKKIECKTGGNVHWFWTSDRTPYWQDPNSDCDGDGTLNKNETGYPGTIKSVYVKGSDPDHDAAWRIANYPWNLHGASECAGHWWEITFNTTPDHDTEANMCAWPNGPTIDYPGPLYPTWPP